MHPHQTHPAVETRAEPARQLFILPEAAFRHLPVELLFQPLPPPFRLCFFLAALLAPRFNKQGLTRLGVVFQFTDGRDFFAALLNDVQRKGMEGSRGDILGV